MKLDQALKLYIALYFLCFGLTWMISVPMLIHVTPESECLLFVSPYVKYGPSAGKSTMKRFFFSIYKINSLFSLQFCWICSHCCGFGYCSFDCSAYDAIEVTEIFLETTWSSSELKLSPTTDSHFLEIGKQAIY